MLNKEIERRIKNYCNNTEFPAQLYFTESEPIMDINCPDTAKWFLKYQGTNNVARYFSTEEEIISFLTIMEQ